MPIYEVKYKNKEETIIIDLRRTEKNVLKDPNIEWCKKFV